MAVASDSTPRRGPFFRVPGAWIGPVQFLGKAMAGLRFDVGPKTHFHNTTSIYLKQKQSKKADPLKASIPLPTKARVIFS